MRGERENHQSRALSRLRELVSVRCADWLWSEVLWHFPKKNLTSFVVRCVLDSRASSGAGASDERVPASQSYWIRRRFAEITVNTVCCCQQLCGDPRDRTEGGIICPVYERTPAGSVCVCACAWYTKSREENEIHMNHPTSVFAAQTNSFTTTTMKTGIYHS